MSEKIKYDCSKCGNCCRFVKELIANKDNLPLIYKKLADEFPYSFKENGECEMLENNECKIYDDRPDFCNIKTVFERTKDGNSLIDYYKKNKTSCEKLKTILKN